MGYLRLSDNTPTAFPKRREGARYSYRLKCLSKCAQGNLNKCFGLKYGPQVIPLEPIINSTPAVCIITKSYGSSL